MSNILKKIEAYKRQEIAAAKRACSPADVEARAKAAPLPARFHRRDPGERFRKGVLAVSKRTLGMSVMAARSRGCLRPRSQR